MAPRGIVAAATSSTFALGLTRAGIGGGAEKLIPITFIVITATALIYGLSGGPVARALGVANTGPGGVLLVGGSPVARTIGQALQDHEVSVVLWTANDDYAKAATAAGLSVYRGNPIEDATAGTPSDLEGVEYALVVGDDEALDAMIATDLFEYFGRDHVFQLPPKEGREAEFLTRVSVLFDDSATHDGLLARIEAGAEVAVAEGPARPDGHTNFNTQLGADGMAMFVLTPGEDLRVLSAGDETKLVSGQKLIGLTSVVDKNDGRAAPSGAGR
jgi:hypothetical protein